MLLRAVNDLMMEEHLSQAYDMCYRTHLAQYEEGAE